MKTLVYYNIGYNKKYNNMLELSLMTLKMHYNDDILIITDIENSLLLKQKKIFNDVLFMIIEKPSDKFEVALNRVRIFEYNKFDDYDVILYLDCDTLIINSLYNIFEKTIKNKKIAITQEKNKEGNLIDLPTAHVTDVLKNIYIIEILNDYWGAFLYDNDNYNNKIALNSGIICLPTSKKTKKILNDIYIHGIEDNKKIHNYCIKYGEQPYINYHLQKNFYFFCIDDVYFFYDEKIINDDLTNIIDYDKRYKNYKYIKDYTILHFIGPEWGTYEYKYNRLFNMLPEKIKKNIEI
jgi:lipopolysaccharide biosynthesis glycosyltransferase